MQSASITTPRRGTATVDSLVNLPDARQVISRLSVVELHSVFAKKVRIGELDEAVFQKLTRRVRGDVGARRLRVIRLTAAHFQVAERLIRRIGPVQNLRTLDALQLAVAVSLNDPSQPIVFVCLCTPGHRRGAFGLEPWGDLTTTTVFYSAHNSKPR